MKSFKHYWIRSVFNYITGTMCTIFSLTFVQKRKFCIDWFWEQKSGVFVSWTSQNSCLNQTLFSLFFQFGKGTILLKSKILLKSNVLKSKILKSKNYCTIWGFANLKTLKNYEKERKLYSFEQKKTYCEAIIIVKKYFSTMSYKVFNTSFEAVGSCIMESRVTPYIFGCNLHSFTLAYKVKLHETLLGTQ